MNGRPGELLIANEVQNHATKAHLAQFEAAARNMAARLRSKPSKLERLELEAVEAQAEALRSELDQYERLRSGAVSTFEASSLADLATLLVKARIARGWSQRRLAEAIGIAEQQVQRYEATEYRSASLARLREVAIALHLTISLKAELGEPNGP